MMPKPTDFAFAAALRPIADALITPESVRREREHDHTHDKSGQIRAERIEGRLRDNRTGVIDAASVMLPATETEPVRSLKKHMEDTGGLGPAGPQGPPGESGVVGAWSLLTTGDLTDPQLVFVDGDVILVETGESP